MLKNYLLITLRNLLKNKFFTIINVTGLAVGLTCVLLISLFIRYELSYDRFHSKADRIYRVTRDFWSSDGVPNLHLATVAPMVGPLLQQDFPDLEATTRMLLTDAIFQKGSEFVEEERVYFADPGTFEIFDIPLKKGNARDALAKPFTILLSEELAQKYFPNQNPVGKTLTYKLEEKISLQVRGVFEALPAHSHLRPRCIISFRSLEHPTLLGKETLRKNWGENNFATYILTPKNYDTRQIEEQLDGFMDKNMGRSKNRVSDWTHLYLQKLSDIHLHSGHLDWADENKGDIVNVYILALVAVFILIVAVINFVNLATAQSVRRAKEIGIRKVMGGHRKALIFQFLLESVLLCSFSGLLALGLTELSIPLLNRFLGTQLTGLEVLSPLWIFGVILFFVMIGVISGLYPAFYLSAFQPVRVLKGKGISISGRSPLRRVLVVTQFSVSIGLMVCTALVYQQLQYIKDKPLGFAKDHVLILPNYLSDSYESFRSELLKNPNIKQAGQSSHAPTERLTSSQGSVQLVSNDSLQETEVVLKTICVDTHFMDAYGIGLAAGRNFSKDFPTDSSAFIINEKTARMLGWAEAAEAIDARIQYGGAQGRIIGVYQDFHFESLHEAIPPSVFILREKNNGNLAIQLSGQHLSNSLAYLEDTWKKFLPEIPFSYTFLEEDLARMYRAEERWGSVFLIFAGLAIGIACMGLLGLALFMAQQRTKEIGIRKVLGARVGHIFGLLTRDFLVLVLLANVIALPLAYYAMHQWLQNFAYRLSLIEYWYLFLCAGLVALLIALLTVSVQVLQIARVNPVKVLRSE